MTLAWWRRFRRSRVCRQVATSTAARSAAETGARRVSVAARTRTEPRTTRLGEIGAEGPQSSCGRSLMVTLGAEELLQAVVGRWQVGNLPVGEQSGPVAPGDLEEAIDRPAQPAAGVLALVPLLKQAGVARLDVLGGAPGRVLEDPRRGVDPAVGRATVRPQRAGLPQALGEQGAQLPQLGRQAPPFSSIRPRLGSILSRRSCSRSPAASSGGRRRSAHCAPPRSSPARSAPPRRRAPQPCARSAGPRAPP